jgi:hypothetical protein
VLASSAAPLRRCEADAASTPRDRLANLHLGPARLSDQWEIEPLDERAAGRRVVRAPTLQRAAATAAGRRSRAPDRLGADERRRAPPGVPLTRAPTYMRVRMRMRPLHARARPHLLQTMRRAADALLAPRLCCRPAAAARPRERVQCAPEADLARVPGRATVNTCCPRARSSVGKRACGSGRGVCATASMLARAPARFRRMLERGKAHGRERSRVRHRH